MKKFAIVLGAAVLPCSATFARGPEWVETGDAGSLPGSAQIITGSPSAPLTKVSGTLQGFNPNLAGGGDFEDMYCLCVTVPSLFCILTSAGSGGSANFNTQLWVFDSFGRAVMGNDDATPNDTGSAIFQFATDGTEAGIYEPGLYYICISGAGNQPSGFGKDLYNFLTPTEISGPDGPGGESPVTGWGGEGEIGEYTIAVNGVCPVPGPGGLAALSAAAMLGRRRRR